MAAGDPPAAALGPQPTPIQTKPPFVAFKSDSVPPSQSLYLQLNDSLYVRQISNVSLGNVTFTYRYLTPQGEIKEGQVPLALLTAATFLQIPLGESWLLSFTVSNIAGAGQFAYTHIQVGIVRGIAVPGITPFQEIIWQGYVYNFGRNGWPGSTSKEQWDSAGSVRVVVGTTPAAGADINETCPSGRRWQLLSLSAILTASAAVANRIPRFTLDDGANVFYSLGPVANQVATNQIRYNMVPGATAVVDAGSNTNLPGPPIIQLKNGFRIRTVTQNLQAADQWTAPIYEILEWASDDS